MAARLVLMLGLAMVLTAAGCSGDEEVSEQPATPDAGRRFVEQPAVEPEAPAAEQPAADVPAPKPRERARLEQETPEEPGAEAPAVDSAAVPAARAGSESGRTAAVPVEGESQPPAAFE